MISGTMEKIILASGSPRRSELLRLAEISFEVIVPGTDEQYPPELLPPAAALYVAREKAHAADRIARAGNKRTAITVLAADTMVVLDKDVIGKPADRTEAIEILTRLSGRIHTVVTGVCILREGKSIEFSEETEVEFTPLTASQIGYYVDHYHPYDKAGAYAIQEWIGATGIRAIRGDFYNVMGLPVRRVVEELEKQGTLESL
jgi:septum formation protein